MLGWVVLGNSVNYHLIYYGKRGNLWHGECMRSTECLLVMAAIVLMHDGMVHQGGGAVLTRWLALSNP